LALQMMQKPIHRGLSGRKPTYDPDDRGALEFPDA
jgi:hypothetical protein